MARCGCSAGPVARVGSIVKPIVVDVYELARSGQSVSGQKPIAAMSRLASQLASEQGDVRYRFSGLVDARGRCAASISLDATLSLVCNHCDKPVSYTLGLRRAYYFIPDESSLDAVDVDTSDEEALVGHRCFDLGELIEDEMILDMPIAPRHADCQLEVDSSSGPSAFDRETLPRPFAALAGLRVRQR